ncbi:MAG TPA: hypothetical protein VK699_01650 [Terriglobales bacterium]|nr:hypothetical protein [Terriglobales bacterium]
MLLHKLRERLTESFEAELRRKIETRIQSGELTYDSPVSLAWDCPNLDSLDLVDLQMQIEELEDIGLGPTVPTHTVGDLLWLLKALEFQKQQKKTKINHNILFCWFVKPLVASLRASVSPW